MDGTYTYADNGEQRYAAPLLPAGARCSRSSASPADGTGAPREILPQPGDTFTVQGDVAGPGCERASHGKTATQDGEHADLRRPIFRWEELDAAPANTSSGFMVEDLDGQEHGRVYEGDGEVICALSIRKTMSPSRKSSATKTTKGF